jgi:hypothetical protein
MKKLLDVSVRKGERISFEEWKSSLVKVEECDHLTRCSELAAEDTERYEGMQSYKREAKMRSEALNPPAAFPAGMRPEMGGEG